MPQANNMIDLRSDTAIQPTAAMLNAIRAVQFRDDLLREDESTNKLIEKTCMSLGLEDAVLTPSGTMSNQIAVATLTRPGVEVVLGPESHIRNLEGAGLAANAGVQIRCVPVHQGVYDTDALEAAVRATTLQEAPTGLISLEATYDLNSGYVTPLDNYREIRHISNAHGVPVFLDGARVFNSAYALGVDPIEICQYVDAVQFCLNKGLGAPLGSMLLGSKEFIRRARHVRQRLGGGMRHTALLAAPALLALDQWQNTIASDHFQARWLADRLHTVHGLTVNNLPIPSNIINLRIAPEVMTADRFIEALNDHDIFAKSIGDSSVRLATHRSIQSADLEYVCRTIAQLLNTSR